MAFRIARRRYEPKDARIRTRLGLPARVEVAACPKCGEVHLKQGCTKEASLHRDLFAMSVEELRWRLEQREVCQMVNEDVEKPRNLEHEKHEMTRKTRKNRQESR
jgi:Zn-finger nucleic acid-binding protein